MERGDLSNSIVPRLLLVFEGALGDLPKDKEAAYSRATKWGRWVKAANYWQLNDLMCQRIWYVSYQLNYKVQIVTFLGPQIAVELAKRLEQEDLPVIGVMSSERHLLARKIVYMQDVAAVYDPDPSHKWTYGGKSRYITRPDDLGRI